MGGWVGGVGGGGNIGGGSGAHRPCPYPTLAARAHLPSLFPQLTLVGHDWGGAVAWTVAAAAAEDGLLSGLVVACCPHPRAFVRNLTWAQFWRSWVRAATL